MGLLDLPADTGHPEDETPRAYLERTLVLPSVECGVDEMLKMCVLATERGEKVDPLNVLATWLMRHNPRHDPSAMQRLEAHATAKRAAVAKAQTQRASSSAVMADEASAGHEEGGAADAAAPAEAAGGEEERQASHVTLNLVGGVTMEIALNVVGSS